MREANILTRGEKLLEQRLPAGWKQKLSPIRRPREADAALRIVSPDGVEALLPVEVKGRVFPRDVPDLKRRVEGPDGRPGLVMTEFFNRTSERTRRQLCTAMSKAGERSENPPQSPLQGGKLEGAKEVGR